MPPIRLSKEKARQFLLDKQGLLGKKRFQNEEGVLEFVQSAGCIQYDPVDVCGKNAEIVLFSRIEGFDKEMLDRLLYEERSLLDHWDKNMSIVATEDFPKLKRIRKKLVEGIERPWSLHSRAYEGVDVKKDLTDNGILMKALENIRKKVGGASHEDLAHIFQENTVDSTEMAKAVIGYLYFNGDLVVHHKENAKRYFDLTEKHLDKSLLGKKDPFSNEKACKKWQTLRRISAVGMLWKRASNAFLGIEGFNKQDARKAIFQALEEEGEIVGVFVEGIKDSLYVLKEDVDKLEENIDIPPRVEFLAPLDSLLWDRPLIKTLFDFDYAWEIYIPKTKRKYGHYTLPVLYKDRFVGRAEIIAQRKDKTLTVKNFWPEGTSESAFKAQFRKRVKEFARFNGCENVRYEMSI